jgi:alginate O-acetyltransferase complex protein AlgI
MLFNSFPFIFAFLPISLAGYYGLNRLAKKWPVKLWLVGCSLFFYSYWNIKNLPLLLLSILANYLVAHTIWQAKQESTKRRFFFLGLGFNLGILSFFKYSGVLLPLGLSFYTLQQIVWLTDNYQGLGEKKSFLDYLLTVSFFPQLISGPMAFYRELMPQLERPQFPTTQRLFLGCMLFTLGLIKKVLISETFAAWAKLGFEPNISPDFFLAWKSSLSYTFQLYYDFSGYTDMAIGIAYLLFVQNR